MRRYVLLGILIITAGWGGRVLFKRHREAEQRQREAVWWQAYQHATQMFYQGDYGTAEKTFTDILPNAEKWYPKDRRLGELLSMLGTSYREEHKYEQAEPVLKRALEVYETISPSDSLGKEHAELNLAGVYLDREDYASAERYFSDALSISERTPGGPKYERGNALLNLGFIRMMQGHYMEAEQLLNRSVEALASDSTPWAQRDLANARYRLGGVYAMGNRYGEARQQFLKALEIQEKVSGPNSREVGRTLEGLGQTYQAEGNTSKATELLNRAQEIARRSAAPGDNSRADILVDLGEAAQDQRKYAEAEALYKRAIDVYEKAAGPEHSDLARALVYLGCLYRDEEQFDITQRDLKKLSQAETSLKRALMIREKNLPSNHPWIAVSLENLASVYLVKGEYGKAAPLIKRAQAIRLHS